MHLKNTVYMNLSIEHWGSGIHAVLLEKSKSMREPGMLALDLVKWTCGSIL